RSQRDFHTSSVNTAHRYNEVIRCMNSCGFFSMYSPLQFKRNFSSLSSTPRVTSE
ncbi:hypothetical protein J6590_105024, partial [Homalodisca vitripennis]